MYQFKVKFFMGEWWVFEGTYPAEGGYKTESEAKKACKNMNEAWN